MGSLRPNSPSWLRPYGGGAVGASPAEGKPVGTPRSPAPDCADEAPLKMLEGFRV